MVSWGIRLREISCWSTVPKIVVLSISEIFELTPTNWNGPGFVSWVSVWHVVYSDTEILARSRGRCEQVFSSWYDDASHCAYGAHVVSRLCAQHSLHAVWLRHTVRKMFCLFYRWRNWDARRWARATQPAEVLASIHWDTPRYSLVLGFCT